MTVALPGELTETRRPVQFPSPKESFDVTPIQVDLIRASWAKVEPIQELAASLFYDRLDRKSTRLNSSHVAISYAVFCLKKKKKKKEKYTHEHINNNKV